MDDFYSVDAQKNFKIPLTLAKGALKIPPMFIKTVKVLESRNQHFYSRFASATYYNDKRSIDHILNGYQYTDIRNYKLDSILSTEEHLIFHNARNAHTILAFRGSNRIRDWGTNLGILTSVESFSARFSRSEKVALRTLDKYGKNVTVTGHSLGGSIGQEIAMKHDLDAHIFNSAESAIQNISKKTLEVLGQDTSRITHYRTHGDIVSLSNIHPSVNVGTKLSLGLDPLSQHSIENFYDDKAKIVRGGFVSDKLEKMATHSAYLSHVIDGVQLAFSINDVVNAVKTNENTEDANNKIITDLSGLFGMNLDPDYRYDDNNVGSTLKEVAYLLQNSSQRRETRLENIGNSQKAGIYKQVDANTLTKDGVVYRQV